MPTKQIPLEFAIETEQGNGQEWKVAYIVQSKQAQGQPQARVELPHTFADQQEATQQAVEVFTSMIAGQTGGTATTMRKQ